MNSPGFDSPEPPAPAGRLSSNNAILFCRRGGVALLFAAAPLAAEPTCSAWPVPFRRRPAYKNGQMWRQEPPSHCGAPRPSADDDDMLPPCQRGHSGPFWRHPGMGEHSQSPAADGSKLDPATLPAMAGGAPDAVPRHCRPFSHNADMKTQARALCSSAPCGILPCVLPLCGSVSNEFRALSWIPGLVSTIRL